MSTVEQELDLIQERLHDNGVLWPREELLRWFNDGYGAILAGSNATRRWNIHDIPPRTAWAVSFEWEARHAPGTFRKFTKTSLAGQRLCTYEWEIESNEGATPTNSNFCVTQLWEMEHAGVIDDHYRFFLPASHERILRVAWNDKRMFGTSAQELDLMEGRWWQEEGEPTYWLRGQDRDKSFEAYQIETSYHQSYFQTDVWGLPRLFESSEFDALLLEGDRSYSTVASTYQNAFAYTNPEDAGTYIDGLGWRFTYETNPVFPINTTFLWEWTLMEAAYGVESYGETPYGGSATDTDAGTAYTHSWESEHLDGEELPTFALGMLRAISSPDRQYLPQAYDTGELPLFGSAREFKSSRNNISILETIVHTRDLEEDDTPGLIPEKMQKYLRFYVWGMAFGREGEGQNPIIAKHYMDRFQQGTDIMKMLANITNLDREYSRGESPVLNRRMPGHPRLPSHYPAFT
jgi:hypothetical protein